MKILYVAEILGKAGLYAFKKGLPVLKKDHSIDFIVACGDGITGGNGIGRNHAAYLRKLGADVITTGECCFYKKDLTENINKMPYVLRPENLSPQAPGSGSRIFRVGGPENKNPASPKVAVAVLLGQSGFSRVHGDNPFVILNALLERLRLETPYVILDFHAQATGEKQTLFLAADGRCSAVLGSHTRVQTADERILPGGTAVITDAGRTGSLTSVGGSEIAPRIQEYISGIPDWSRDTWADPQLEGVLLELEENGRAKSIRRVRLPVPGSPPPPKEEHSAEDSE
ncbi:MAG: YmdB family metallophosphoesterase [Treponema sp.]|jgi:metallophosphoesterase (TIGR00282 family)|nr:YmdB family metallophosphoesterase [Treponema sp.]